MTRRLWLLGAPPTTQSEAGTTPTHPGYHGLRYGVLPRTAVDPPVWVDREVPWCIGRAKGQPERDRRRQVSPLGSVAAPATSCSSNTGDTACGMRRFVGYLERRPYLWLVYLATRSIEPAAELRDFPQGIDEVVSLDTAVAVRCGPTWFALEPDLSGKGRPLTDAELFQATQRSVSVDWPQEPSVYERRLVLPSQAAEQGP